MHLMKCQLLNKLDANFVANDALYPDLVKDIAINEDLKLGDDVSEYMEAQ